MSDEANLDAYLRRIDYAGSIAPTLETLTTIHGLHPEAIPFENLDPLLERPVRLPLTDIEQKLLIEGRGGYCLEHNLLLKAALESMDFGVTAVAARVLWGRAADDASDLPEPGHLALIVDVGGVPYLADVGFGAQVLTAPLRLRAGPEQTTPHDRFRLVGGDPVYRLESEIAGAWRPLYDFERTPIDPEAMVAMNDRAMKAFRDFLIAARIDGPRRLGLFNNRLNTHEAGETTTRRLETVAELRDALASTFKITLPADERLDATLERVLQQGSDA